MRKIKLLKLSEMDNGTIRLQSQMMIGKETADFIIEDGALKVWDRGNNGFDFYDYPHEYEIVNSISEMKSQTL